MPCGRIQTHHPHCRPRTVIGVDQGDGDFVPGTESEIIGPWHSVWYSLLQPGLSS
jgi:hypothetical protein